MTVIQEWRWVGVASGRSGLLRTARSLLILLPFFLVAVDAPAGRHPRASAGGSEVVPGVVVIKVKSDVAHGALQKSPSPVGSELLSEGIQNVRRAFPNALPPLRRTGTAGEADLTRIFFGDLPPSANPSEVAVRLSRLVWVEYAEPKYFQKLHDFPNDPFLANQAAALSRLNAFNGWTIAKGTRPVAIATVDGGTSWRHEDLEANLWINPAEDINHNGKFDRGAPPIGDEDGIDNDGNGVADDVIGWNFTANSNDPDGLPSEPNSRAHGTATASNFGAVTDNGKGMAGTSWNCSLMPICVAARNDDLTIEFGYEGIEYAFRMGAKVINCSWGRGGGASKFEQDVLNAAAASGALVIVSAGNDTLDVDHTPQFPTSYRNVLAVGATRSADDVIAGFSNYGVSVPVYAPGVNILGAYPDSGYNILNSGTSFSSPLVAGLAGILAGQNPNWTPLQIAAQIRVTADSIDAVAGNRSLAGKLGRGRVNFARALSEVHAGLDVSTFHMRTPAGKTLFVRGDSILLGVTLANILQAPSQNLQIRLTSLDPEVQVLQGSASLPLLAPGQSADLPDFVCQVSSITSQVKVVVLKLEWVSNGNERDAYTIRANVYPSLPSWLLQPSATTARLSAVRAVSSKVVWTAGGDGSGSPSVVLRTIDGGDSWSDRSGNLPAAELVCVEAVDSNRAWAGTSTGQIFATTDGGRFWSQQSYDGVQSPFIDGIWFFDQFNGRALGDPAGGGSQFVLLRTVNGGVTWNHITSEPIGSVGEVGYYNSFVWVDTLHGWFGSSAGHVWRTTDAGNTWLNAPSGGTNSVGISFGELLHGIAIHENGILSRTSDGGASWRVVTSPSSWPLNTVAFAPGTSSAWIGATADIARSHDSGVSWGLQISSPFSGSITAMSVSDTLNGWVVTSNGEILKYSPSLANNDSVPNPLPIPSEFGLDQNYPNPFNGTTRIRFQIVQPSHVEITLYDLLGRRVRTLVDGDYTAATHEIQFSAADGSTSGVSGVALSSGLYFYRLTVTGTDGRVLYRTTRKMMLIR